MTHDRAEFSGGFTQGGAAGAEGSWSTEKGEKQNVRKGGLKVEGSTGNFVQPEPDFLQWCYF